MLVCNTNLWFLICLFQTFFSSVTFVAFTLTLHNSDYENATHHYFWKSHIYTFDDKDAPHWQRKWSFSVRLYLSCRKFFNGFVMFDLRSFGCSKNDFLSFRCTKSVKADKSTISFYTNIIQIYAQRCRQIILCRCCCKLLTMLMYV